MFAQLLLARIPDLIISTDLSIDVDDVGALAVAHALVDRGEARLLAIVHDTGLHEGPGAVAVINDWYRRDVPIGVNRGVVGAPEFSALPAWTHEGAQPCVVECEPHR
jgi:hypothetical protein